MTDPTAATAAAAAWLHQTYRGQAELADPRPCAEDENAWVYSCRPLAQPGYPATPMLAASLAVPKRGGAPFHLANTDPWADLAASAADPVSQEPGERVRRLNARGCVVSVDAMMAGGRASALPWKPSDEAPGWWQRLVRRYFTGAQVAACADWNEVVAAVRDGGPDARGVVWVRREFNGAEVAGHLLYVAQTDGQVALLDGQTGGLARLDTSGVRKLTLARFTRPAADPGAAQPPFRRPAPDLAGAIAKARAWLTEAHGDQAVLVDPQPSDELARGWLFACNTRGFLATGRPEEAMLDAAIVVPKNEQEPFSLPNSRPWEWLERWNAGAEPGDEGMDLIPRPGPTTWWSPTLSSLGRVLGTAEFDDWPPLLATLSTLPDGARALVWVRRRDRRGRESVGHLLNAAMTNTGIALIDPLRDAAAELESTEHLLKLRLIRYR